MKAVFAEHRDNVLAVDWETTAGHGWQPMPSKAWKNVNLIHFLPENSHGPVYYSCFTPGPLSHAELEEEIKQFAMPSVR